eukprot:1793862-Pleurochrysis_carterae.AAC.1
MRRRARVRVEVYTVSTAAGKGIWEARDEAMTEKVARRARRNTEKTRAEKMPEKRRDRHHYYHHLLPL